MLVPISEFAKEAVLYASGFVVGLIAIAAGLQILIMIRRYHSVSRDLVKSATALVAATGTNLAAVSYMLVANNKIHVNLTEVAQSLVAVISSAPFLFSAGAAVGLSSSAGFATWFTTRRRKQRDLRQQSRLS